jgi:flagellar basal body rod protein FlgG
MEDALVSVASALNVYERKLDAAALNVVHARTPGYFPRIVGAKSFASEFNDAAAATHVAAVEGVSVKPGEPIPSQNPLAVAIVGEGFFEVKSPVGSLYTRGGDFELVDGAIATRGGFPVEGVDGPLRPNPLGGPVRFDESGRVLQDGAELGRLKIVRFEDAQNFLPAGETLVAPDGGAGPSVVEAARIAPGMVEVPAQNAVQGLVDMVAIHRGFEGAQRAATVMHDAFERLLRSPN